MLLATTYHTNKLIYPGRKEFQINKYSLFSIYNAIKYNLCTVYFLLNAWFCLYDDNVKYLGLMELFKLVNHVKWNLQFAFLVLSSFANIYYLFQEKNVL